MAALGRLLNRYPRDAWRDAARLGLQAAAAGVATYAALRALGLSELFLGVLSAVMILNPSVGGTMGSALTRLQATLAGSLLALACLYWLPEGWGTAAAVGLSVFVVYGIAGLRSDWSYGVVPAVGIALAPHGEMLETAWDRGIVIVLGAGIGVAVSLLVWPDRAERRFERHLRAALRATATRLSDAIEATMEPSREAAPPDHVSAYHKALGQAQDALDSARFVDPAGMRRRLEALRRLYNSVIILDRAAEGDTRPISGAETLREQVDVLRRDACAVLTSLAEGKGPDRRFDGIDAALRRLREALAEEDPDSDLHESRDVVAFGLREVRRSMAELIEASRA